ncbi:hypothetical protein Zmor_008743 [Zophobas morio]|uniref:Rap-GAP domain-containing protein n=2 Tax=Zophobas morio TaxID=2755281 RepID=A0AA38M0F8_9CUCU|nr:hypothetical protein Zmor_008743 [Zophobas morio]
MGFLSYENRQHFFLLEKNEGLLRRLRQLDRTGSRETHKIGVMYIAPGQEHETLILNNQAGSKLYENFLASIGWEVELETHKGFNGFLDPKSNGETTVYYANSIVEMVFHVATRMPTEENFSVTKKKRHIHNDRVQIIWTEHWRDFHPDIMRTEFKDALIVIRPLLNGLFAVNILKAEEVPPFGPLQNNTVVPEAALPGLVRETAINASRAVMTTIPSFHNFFQQRDVLLTEIKEKHKMRQTFEEFTSVIINPKS